MRNVFAVLPLLAVLALASPSLAAGKGERPALPSAPPADAPTVPADEATREFALLVQSNAPYQAMVLKGEDFIGQVMQGANLVLDDTARPTPAAIAAWKARVLAAEAEIRAQRDALPAYPTSQFTLLNTDPALARTLTSYKKLPSISREIANTVLDVADRMIPLVERAGAGDKSAVEPLQSLVLDGLIATIEAENSLLELSLASSPEAHPQTALTRSMRASNTALVDLFKLAQLGNANREDGVDALVQDLAAQLNEAESQARKVGPLARYLMQTLDTPEVPAAMRPKLQNMLATYAQSGDVELQIVGVIRQMITKADSPAAASAVAEDLQPLVERRLDLQNTRNQQFAG